VWKFSQAEKPYHNTTQAGEGWGAVGFEKDRGVGGKVVELRWARIARRGYGKGRR